MRHLLLAVALLLLIPASTVHAADECLPGANRADDMAGTYLNVHAQMRVMIFDCGGVHVLWSNEYGTHEAIYYTVERLQSGGLLATVVNTGGGPSLDGRRTLGLKPAEPGWIEAFTMGPFGDNLRIYRLRKMG